VYVMLLFCSLGAKLMNRTQMTLIGRINTDLSVRIS
jgi:hypothetical protein